jgi:hypothetical protein
VPRAIDRLSADVRKNNTAHEIPFTRQAPVPKQIGIVPARHPPWRISAFSIILWIDACMLSVLGVD